MMTVSLVLNILVLVPVCAGLLTGAVWADAAYGPASPARGILLSVYLAILLLSAGLLIHQVPAAVAALLLVQVIYKATTPLTVGSFGHPVVMANLAIVAVHAVTLFMLWRAARGV
jgi:hypothetical protein